MEHRGRFIAYDESGKEYGINKYVEVRNESTRDDPHATIDVAKELRTDEGYRVKYLEKGKYEIFETGIVVSSCDPNAP